MIPLALVLWCWSPDFAAALEQFRWCLGTQSPPTADKLISLFHNLRLSKYFVISLILVVWFLLVPLSLLWVRRPALARTAEGSGPLLILATAFSVAGFLTVVRGALPYYLVYFTSWPILGLSVLWESSRRAKLPWARTSQALFYTALCAVCSAWLISLAWNALRLRESVLYSQILDQRAFSRKLSRLIPRGTKVVVSPDLFLIAELADLDYELLPWFNDEAEVPPNAWLLLIDRDWTGSPARIARTCIENRSVLLNDDIYGNYNKYFHINVIVLGCAEGFESPARAAATRGAVGLRSAGPMSGHSEL
jgi:hypothetical protein